MSFIYNVYRLISTFNWFLIYTDIDVKLYDILEHRHT